MKKKITLQFLALLCLLIPFKTMQAQKDSLKIKTFGLGVHVEQFRLSAIVNSRYGDFYPPNKIIFSISFNNQFRIEPELGLATSHNKTTDLNTSSTTFGLGLLGMMQRGRLNIPIGVRIEDNVFKTQEIGRASRRERV